MSELGTQRHHARERALEILYEASIKNRSVSTIVAELKIVPDPFVLAILSSTEEYEETAHDLITRFAIDWPLERIAVVDRLVMTLAVGEMMMADAAPTAVILDEAVELAKVFSTEGSASFVNGILSSIAQNLPNRKLGAS